MSEIWLYDLACGACGHEFKKSLAELKGKGHELCPKCGKTIELAPHKSNIANKLRQAGEIDKQGPHPD
jgi:ribosomal protein S27AE